MKSAQNVLDQVQQKFSFHKKTIQTIEKSHHPFIEAAINCSDEWDYNKWFFSEEARLIKGEIDSKKLEKSLRAASEIIVCYLNNRGEF